MPQPGLGWGILTTHTPRNAACSPGQTRRGQVNQATAEEPQEAQDIALGMFVGLHVSTVLFIVQ